LSLKILYTHCLDCSLHQSVTETETKKVVSRPRWSRDLNIPGNHK